MTARSSEQTSPDQPPVTRVAIVGSGAVANHHARHLASCSFARLVAVVDTNRQAAESFATKWRIPRVYGSFGELLTARETGVVHITTPPNSHESLARQAIERGLDVIVEKPIAYTRAATAQLYELARANNVRLVPDYSLFFVEQMCLAREWVEEGRVGRIVCVECLYQTRLDRARLEEPMTPPWLFELPGGPLHNFFTHPLYLALQFTGPVNGLHIVPRHIGYLPQGLTDNLDLMIDGAHCSAFVTVSLAAKPAQTCLVIHGEKGRITVEFDSFQTSLEMASARLGSAMRLLRPALRGAGAIRQTGVTALKVLRRRLLPYAGLQALIERFYASPRSARELPISEDLVLAVAGVEEEIVRSRGVWRLAFPGACATVPAAPRPKWVAVTGGTGYLGSRVVAELRRRGYRVRLLARWQSRGIPPCGSDIEIVNGDARNLDDVRRLIAGTEAVIHLAAGMKGSREFVVQTCVVGSSNVVQVAREFGTSRNIYVSSMAVFDYRGLRRKDFLSDSTALENVPDERSAYAEGKTRAEQAVANEINQAKSPWMILRPSQIFSGAADLSRQLGTPIGRNLVCLGGPRKRMRLVHVDDVARAIVDFVAPEKFQPGKVLNLTHPDIMLARQVAAMLKQRCGLRVFHLRSWLGKTLAWGTRVSRKILKRGPRISARQAAYLFCESGAEAKTALSLGWRPSAPLEKQIEIALQRSVKMGRG